jgi:lipid A disaccharide synthetase
VVGELLSLLEDPARRRHVKEGLEEVRRRLGPPGASERAAAVVSEVLRSVKKD